MARGAARGLSREQVTTTQLDQRLADSDKAVTTALAAAEKAVAAAQASSEKAIDKAERDAEKWRNNANEWRGAMSDREREFLTRREFYVMVGALVMILTLTLAFLTFIAVTLRSSPTPTVPTATQTAR
jgi:hypothetical protein